MVHDDAAVGLDGVEVVFDDERLVSDAGIALVATLAGRLGIEALVGRFVTLRRDRPGAANAGRKVMALVYAMLLGADCIDDCDLLRSGRTGVVLGDGPATRDRPRRGPGSLSLRPCPSALAWAETPPPRGSSPRTAMTSARRPACGPPEWRES